MTSWRQVEEAAPELAAQVRAAFLAGKHATMATLRADGAPRISGTEVEFSDDGELRLGSMPGAFKARDLQRDPRLAVHSPTTDPGEGGAGWPGEAKVAGRAIEEQRQGDAAHVFRLDLTEVVWTGLTEDRSALRIRSWHPGRGVEDRVRT
ncbi:pyridoxamine 5'-phosphate oxidase [Blastococcus sp. TF02-09]|uniref:pyridoxamine 5'-phosphate oxidase family protein n=1 Tax=Blastococcus sp. TF02-09 TaxID=2250576 RepID=UPI000DE906A2|nr:pyridoxamine 5'-phosphate oxidase family protein [Blastococcus sp. TF02-9]RBY75944.1 pyridoxamine 5'-phosphate oxidase [Blastococcus sp. TF02-9]